MLLIWEGLDSENLQNKRQRLVKKIFIMILSQFKLNYNLQYFVVYPKVRETGQDEERGHSILHCIKPVLRQHWPWWPHWQFVIILDLWVNIICGVIQQECSHFYATVRMVNEVSPCSDWYMQYICTCNIAVRE